MPHCHGDNTVQLLAEIQFVYIIKCQEMRYYTLYLTEGVAVLLDFVVVLVQTYFKVSNWNTIFLYY